MKVIAVISDTHHNLDERLYKHLKDCDEIWHAGDVGHSHILKVMYDKKLKIMHMNPGAVGDYGIHKVKTILKFIIEGNEIKDLKVIEIPRK